MQLRQVAIFLLPAACAAPRSVTESGRVTPRGEFRAHYDILFNVPTGTATALGSAAKDAASNVADKTDKNFDDNVNTAAKAGIAWALDPIGMGNAMGVRYGVYDRIDAGYKYATGTHVVDARFQFMGAPGNKARDGAGEGGGGMDASIGVQASRQTYEPPGFLKKVGEVFGFHMSRTDILVPVAFSYPFGADEKFGALSFGAVAGYTFLDYGLEPHELVKNVNGVDEVVEGVTRKQGYPTFGAFVFVKGGYRYAYVGLGLAAYYQDYGRFQLMDKVDVQLDGVTLVPTASIELRY